MSYVKDEALEFTSIVTEEVFKEGLETVYEQGYYYDTRFDYVEDNGQGKFVKEYRYENECHPLDPSSLIGKSYIFTLNPFLE